MVVLKRVKWLEITLRPKILGVQTWDGIDLVTIHSHLGKAPNWTIQNSYSHTSSWPLLAATFIRMDFQSALLEGYLDLFKSCIWIHLQHVVQWLQRLWDHGTKLKCEDQRKRHGIWFSGILMWSSHHPLLGRPKIPSWKKPPECCVGWENFTRDRAIVLLLEGQILKGT